MQSFSKYFKLRKRKNKKQTLGSTGNKNLDNNTNPLNKDTYLNPPYGTEGRMLTPGSPNL
jgi:hypothetical protein